MPRAIVSLAFAWLMLSASGCLLLEGLGSNGQGGSAPSTSEPDAGSAQGIHCGQDPDTSFTLCLGISLCPGLSVDQEAFPGCGFRVNSHRLDVECSCSGFLCPLGVASDCAAVQSLLSQSYAGAVCAQISAGVCTEGTPVVSLGSSTCDPVCRSECAGMPTCIQACGC